MQIYVGCDNMGGLSEHVTFHMFRFFSRPFLFYIWDRTKPAATVDRF